MNILNVNNFFYPHWGLTPCQGEIVDNFFLKKGSKYLELSKCQSPFTMGIIALQGFNPHSLYTLPHFLPPNMVLTL
jgi:hypothetical protein